MTTLAGLARNVGSADGMGSGARFDFPICLAVDAAGNVFVSDYANNTIRKVTATGVVTTFAGLAGVLGSADGTGSAARFYNPSGLAVDTAGNLYAADTYNDTIRKISPAGAVTTLAGMAGVAGWVDGTGSAARFDMSWGAGVAVDAAGNVYVGDQGSSTIRKITPAGAVTTLAGTGYVVGSADGAGSAAQFNSPFGVKAGTDGTVYVVDEANHTIRKITPAGVVTTLAGLAGVSGSADGVGSAAQFNYPSGVAVDSAGNGYVADTFNNTIRMVTPAGVATTFAGLAGAGGWVDGNGSAARFRQPYGLARDTTGNLYVADRRSGTIRKISPLRDVTTLAGLDLTPGSADGAGSAARFNWPQGIAVDTSGNLYVADTRNQTIRKVTPGGDVSTLAGSPGARGYANGTGSAARFNNPTGVAVDSAGTVYVADTSNHVIRKVTSAGVVTTLAGSGSWGDTDGTGNLARFSWPSSLALDSSGDLYLGDAFGYTIRKITPAGVVTTLAGPGGRNYGNVDGMGGDARFSSPNGVAVSSTGNVYVADADNNAIRIGTPPPLADVAIIDVPTSPPFLLRQLGTAPQTATAWAWNVDRQPSGATAALSATLVRNPTFVPDVQELYRFRLVASGAAGNRVSLVQLDTRCLAFLSSPASSAVCLGSPASFTVSATWTSSPAYQWTKDGAPISGAVSATYSIASAGPADAGTYVCNATNACGSASSPPAVLTVSSVPPGVVGNTLNMRRVGGLVESTWTDIAGATAYNMYQDTSANGTFSAQAGGSAISGTPGLSISISAQDLVFYKVAAANGCGEGPK